MFPLLTTSRGHFSHSIPWSVSVLLLQSRKISWCKLVPIPGVGYAVAAMQFLWSVSRSFLKIIFRVVKRELMSASIALIVLVQNVVSRMVISPVLLDVLRVPLHLLFLRLQLVPQLVLCLFGRVRLVSIAVWLPCLVERKSIRRVKLVVPRRKRRNAARRVRSLV